MSDRQHGFTVHLIVKGLTRTIAERFLHDRLQAWYSEDLEYLHKDRSKNLQDVIQGYGFPDGSLLLFRVIEGEHTDTVAKLAAKEDAPIPIAERPWVCSYCGFEHSPYARCELHPAAYRADVCKVCGYCFEDHLVSARFRGDQHDFEPVKVAVAIRPGAVIPVASHPTIPKAPGVCKVCGIKHEQPPTAYEQSRNRLVSEAALAAERFDADELERAAFAQRLTEGMEADKEDIRHDLEDVIDDVGLEELILTIAQVCREKAEALFQDRQEHGSALQWERAARDIERLAARSGDWP